jgi:cytochrome c oxidase subunit 2
MLRPAGAAAVAIADLGVVIIIGALVIFIATMALLAHVLRRGGTPQTRLSPARWIVGAGVVFPAVVLAALLAYTGTQAQRWAPMQATTETVVAVTGKMWWWEVRYRDPSGDEIFSANEVRIPLGREVTIGLTTSDVIHSFWIPALAGKVDMVPGRVHQLRLRPLKAGVYRGPCAEYCGTQHAKMALSVIVMAPEEFDRWLEQQAKPGVAPTSALAIEGQQLFLAHRCDACHSVRGIGATSSMGPDLTHVASRLTIGAGELPVQREAFEHWVANVQRIKPGAHMPDYSHLGNDALASISAFLERLK